MRGCSLLRRLERDQNKCPLYGIAGCPLLRGFEYIEVYGSTIRTFRIVRYIAGVRRWGVSVKQDSTVQLWSNNNFYYINNVKFHLSVAGNSSLADLGSEVEVTFGEEDTVLQLFLPLVDDDVVEANEVIQVQLSVAVGDGIELTADTATITIIDNDG